MLADLLAVAAQDVEDRLSGAHFSSAHRQVAVWVIASALPIWARPEDRPTLRRYEVEMASQWLGSL